MLVECVPRAGSLGFALRSRARKTFRPAAVIIASKHQSDWDVFAIFPHTGRPAYIVKKELMNIPFFGWAARSLDCIEIDRKKGAEAIPEQMHQAHDALAAAAASLFFPKYSQGGARPGRLSPGHSPPLY